MSTSPTDVWAGRRVFVTGHTGFKGTWLTRWLTRRGAIVTGYALAEPVSTPALWELVSAREDAFVTRSLVGDIRDRGQTAVALEESEPEVVLHLAAQPLVKQGYRDPVDTFATNVMGTVHLLEAVRRVPTVRAVVVVTSDKCYENPGVGAPPFTESDPMGGADPYSASKGAAELVTSAYRQSFFAEAHGALIASARAGNVIGGGDWGADRLLPDIVRAWIHDEPARIRNPRATRPWQHVLEPLSGYLAVAERLLEEDRAAARGWNFGPHEADVISVRAVADAFTRALGARWEQDGGAHPHEAATLNLSWARAADALGWAPRWRLDEAIARTAAWYRAWGTHRHVSAPDELVAAIDADLDAFARSAA